MPPSPLLTATLYTSHRLENNIMNVPILHEQCYTRSFVPESSWNDQILKSATTQPMVLWKRNPRLKKTTPSSTLRYQRANTVDTYEMSFEPELALHDYLVSPGLADWKQYIHPEGSVYYYNASSRVVTEANLQKPDILGSITYWMAEFEAARCNTSVTLPETYELHLELDLDGDQCSYYVIDHERQTVFWLDAAHTADLNLPEVSNRDHLRLKLKEQYWVHLEYFPMHGTLPASAESTLVGILTHAWGDQTTSALSTAPYSSEQCKNFLAMLDRFIGVSDQDGYKTCIIARLMNEILHSRFVNLYGHPDGARLARNQSTAISPSAPREPRVLRLCSVFLYQYHKELKDLNELWVDNIVYTEHWRAFLASRLQEWKSLSLLSAMLLLIDTMVVVNYHVNPSIFISDLPLVRTGYISGAMSLLLSMSTMVVSVTTVSIHQPYAKSYASEATAYLDGASHEILGLQPLAIALSLPRSLFLWALVTGGIALLSFIFQVLDSWSIVLIGSFVIGLFALLAWLVRFFQVKAAHMREPDGLSKFALPSGGGFPSQCFEARKEALDIELV